MDKLVALAIILVVLILVLQIVIKITSILLKILLWVIILFLILYIFNFFVLPKVGVQPLFIKERDKIIKKVENDHLTKEISKDIKPVFEKLKKDKL